MGSERFVKSIKARYLPDIPHGAIPQQKSVVKAADSAFILHKAARLLGCNLERFVKSRKISPPEATTRDMLIYVIRQLGTQSNQSIGDLFGLTHSAVGRRVWLFKAALKKDAALRHRFDFLKSKLKT